MYLCRKMTDSSFPAIGEAFGRDHSTVIHAYNLIARRIANDSAFRFSIEKIERELKACMPMRLTAWDRMGGCKLCTRLGTIAALSTGGTRATAAKADYAGRDWSTTYAPA